jgi:hypothetical protein
MIKNFFLKKENIFISLIALVSIFFVILGFLFLFFKTNSEDGPRIIPNSIEDIEWEDFSSEILDSKISYPEYLFVKEQREPTGVGVNFSEFEPREFLTYFSNQNHVSIYPDGIDNELFYGKKRQSEYTSSSKEDFTKIEYLTVDNDVWAVMLIPKITPKNWQPRGFIWIQSALKNKEELCVSSKGILIKHVICDPYAGEQPAYRGDVFGQFIRFGYEVINKNSF